jgi:hypothetical protein
MILAVVVHEIVLGREVAVIWTETLVIALAYYFTYRRFVMLSPNVLSRLEQEGVIQRESNPLFLPRGSIRILIVLTIAGLGVYLYQHERLWEPQVMTVLGTSVCYLVGVFFRGLTSWWWKGRKTLASHLWEDLKSITVLLTVAATAVLYFLMGPEQVPHWLATTTVGLVLFYFGSR